MNLNDAYETFIQESHELLEEMESALLRVEEQPDDGDLINAIFRAAHTIKGTAGVFGFETVEGFTHVVENVLDRVRNGGIAISAELVAVLLSSKDHMGVLVESAVDGSGIDAAVHEHGEVLKEALSKFLGAGPAIATESAEETTGTASIGDRWHLSMRFGADALRHGLDPLALLRYLARIGEVTSVTTLHDTLPGLADIDPESCYLGLEVDLRSDASRAEIDSAVEFFREVGDIRVVPPDAAVAEYIRLIEELPEENRRLGEILVNGGAIGEQELAQALARQQAADTSEGPHQRLGEMLVGEGRVPAPVVEAAAEKQEQGRRGSRTIRVDAEKLDQLINLVGELVIAGATTSLIAQRIGDEGLMESNSNMSRLVEEIRDSALRLRMVQIGETFNRFQRVVRDVSRELGKEIRLEISGAETELDKTVVEKIGDPLMHLVRNAMDHGIEPSAEVRRAAGKREHGTVRLNAYHDSGSIVIEVVDDGKGLDNDRILRKAQERGLVAPAQQLGTHEIQRLIFEPGFSTAEQVTNLSGRGVGMDVVKKNIEALRGTVDVESRPGEGTTFTIRLPLTLAIIDGFLVGVGESAYVIPLDMVLECIEVTDEERGSDVDSRYINLRGEVLPFLRLHELFREEPADHGRENIVVVQYGGQKAGLVVDDLRGEFQTVIKPLGKVFRQLSGVSGATILGSGEVAVILDVPQLVQAATTDRERPVLH